MHTIKQGFLKYAKECGVPEPQALHFWKRATAYPGTEAVFKELDTTTAQDATESPEELEALSRLMEQEKINSELQKIKQQLGI